MSLARTLVGSVLLALTTIAISGGTTSVSAQDLTSADNGRYQLMTGQITESGRDTVVTLMIYTQTGRHTLARRPCYSFK